MKKVLIRSISLFTVVALCLGAIQITAFSEPASQANFKQLSEWVEMADALLEKGTTYVAGKDDFDAAYDDAVSILDAGVADAGEISDCIDDLKAAWADLKFETVTEIAPDDGSYNDTGCESFGSSYKTESAKEPKINYTINATGADFWSDIQMIYLYAYGYRTDSVTDNYISGTTLPIGNTYADKRGIRLCTTDYKNAYPSSADGWAHKSLIRRFEFSKTQLNKFITAGNLSRIMLCYDGANTPDATLCAGSLFIVRSFYEQVPVSYELYKWVKRAENLLAQGKTYTEGLDDFNTAIDAAKSATDSDDTSELIEGIKTAWGNLVYADLIEIAPVDGFENNTGCANFGSSYKTESGKTPKIFYDINATGADFWADIEKVYVYAYGYYTGHATGEFISGTTLPIGESGYTPKNNTVRLATPTYSKTAYSSSDPQYVGRGSVRLFEFSKTNLQGFIDLGSVSQIMLCYMGDNTPDATLCAGSLFIFRGTHSENLPSDRIFTWIDRAQSLLGSGADFAFGLDDFNEALAALYASDDPLEEQTLIDNLRSAWNNLCYESEPVAIGYPAIERGTDVTKDYISDYEGLGEHYVCVQSNGEEMHVRLDCDIVTGFPTEWFDDVLEIYFYTCGYKTENPEQAWNSKWTNATLNTAFTTHYYGGANVNKDFTKYSLDKDTVLSKLEGDPFRNVLVNQYKLDEADTWIVGTLYATMKVKVSPSDYGLADYGDVNGDEQINVVDLVHAKKYIAGISDKIAAYALDINDDDNYDATDLSLLVNILLQPTQYSDNQVNENEIF